jgi:hypothetical protein
MIPKDPGFTPQPKHILQIIRNILASQSKPVVKCEKINGKTRRYWVASLAQEVIKQIFRNSVWNCYR